MNKNKNYSYVRINIDSERKVFELDQDCERNILKILKVFYFKLKHEKMKRLFQFYFFTPKNANKKLQLDSSSQNSNSLI